eukprot:6212596-Pleurochrysis_carterae.AAC.4
MMKLRLSALPFLDGVFCNLSKAQTCILKFRSSSRLYPHLTHSPKRRIVAFQWFVFYNRKIEAVYAEWQTAQVLSKLNARFRKQRGVALDNSPVQSSKPGNRHAEATPTWAMDAIAFVHHKSVVTSAANIKLQGCPGAALPRWAVDRTDGIAHAA